jgi:hypothetical protein
VLDQASGEGSTGDGHTCQEDDSGEFHSDGCWGPCRL